MMGIALFNMLIIVFNFDQSELSCKSQNVRLMLKIWKRLN